MLGEWLLEIVAKGAFSGIGPPIGDQSSCSLHWLPLTFSRSCVLLDAFFPTGTYLASA